MKHPALILLLFALPLIAQDQKAITQKPGPAEKTQSTCVIVKRMGPADEVTSHLYSFGIRGKQFQYVEGGYPKGVKFHGRLTDNDVRNIKYHNGRVAILEPGYTADTLKQARESCKEP